LSLADDPAPVLAPADGVVVRTRDDIPDDMEPSVYLGLDDPLYAIGGNGVVLNHGNNEYSMLFHLRHGSVRVRQHDHVRQGDVLGVVGSAGTPGYVHLHYHLQAGPDFLAADGLPVRFENVVMASDWLGPYRRGIPVPVPIRGPYLTTTPD
jgi:murein DD-endopeptidase MepM/ murein hydrolase activator NlpD